MEARDCAFPSPIDAHVAGLSHAVGAAQTSRPWHNPASFLPQWLRLAAAPTCASACLSASAWNDHRGGRAACASCESDGPAVFHIGWYRAAGSSADTEKAGHTHTARPPAADSPD